MCKTIIKTDGVKKQSNDKHVDDGIHYDKNGIIIMRMKMMMMIDDDDDDDDDDDNMYM